MAMDTKGSETLSVEEARARLGISRPSMYRALKNGDIPGSVRVGNLWLIGRNAFERWLAIDQAPQDVA